MTMRSSHDDPRAGFTLVEIMVALAIGGIAIGSLYAIGSASTRQFREQQRVSAAQTSLRAAMDQLKHDFQRAGYLSTPNSAMTGETCFPPTGVDGPVANQLQALFFYAKDVALPPKLDPENLNAAVAPDPPFYKVDDVWLSGNYATSGEYPNISVSADGVTVSIPMAWQSFRRDFTEWSGATMGDCNFAAFDAAFPIGRLVRLHAMNGSKFYSHVSSTTCSGSSLAGSPSTATVVLTEAVPPNCSMNGGWIAPVNVMHYSVVDATIREDASDGRMTVLRRTEVRPDRRGDPLTPAGDTTPLEDRALLDYVVRFNVDFLMRSANTVLMDYSIQPRGTVMANPERIRGVILELAVRTAQPEPEFTSAVPAAAFRVYRQQGSGAARVRRARAELLLPNIANRGL